MVERTFDSEHPEGLTTNQEVLAGLLFDTKIVAPVTRRTRNSDNTYVFSKIERPTAPIDFAQEGEFVLKMHENYPASPLSPVYINLRNLPESVLSQVGVVLAELGGQKPDFCSGIPKAGIPLAQAYSAYSGVSLRDGIFAKEETSARRKIVRGSNENYFGKNLRIVDDLATKGETKVEAIKAAEQMGYRVLDILVLVDRQQGATEQLAKLGYKLRSALTIDQLLQYGVRTKRISIEKYKEVST